jgi:hypothetical protein
LKQELGVEVYCQLLAVTSRQSLLNIAISARLFSLLLGSTLFTVVGNEWNKVSVITYFEI